MSRSAPGRALLSITYLGPVQYFTKFLLHAEPIVEQYDHYIKQTYRNRCHIMGANGMLPLSIPVSKGNSHKTYVRDIRIDNQKKWQKLHWRSIESAYRHSPFFEFYMDELSPFYEKNYSFLLDYDAALLEWLLRSLEMNNNLSYSMEFADTVQKDTADYREVIHPKRDLSSDPFFVPVVYPQVFADRHGFRANLSIIDLLFNEGPNARSVLEQSIAHPA